MGLQSAVFKGGLLTITLLAVMGAAVAQKTYAQNSPQSSSVGFQAKIPADPPTVAASITTPSNGQNFTSLPIQVAGVCSGDLLVKLFKNGVFAGSAQCSNNSYRISTDLFDGKNDLIARVYDALDQAGPDSNTVSVTFTQSGFNTSGPRVALTSSYARRGANPKEQLTWPVVLSGGAAPYAISVDWGDGKNDLVSRSFVGEFTVSHAYDSPGVYSITFKVTDANGSSAFLQLVGVANGALSQAEQSAAKDGTSAQKEVIWWPLAAAGPFVIASFWLGGQSKLAALRKQADQRIQY